jgi:imidazolonepropionase-like amidohydrolase
MKSTQVIRTVAGLTFAGILPLFAQDKKEAPSLTLIENVKIFDGHSEKLAAGNVLIEGNLIKDVGAKVSAPEGATVIDGKGGTLMPGLIDMHSHLVIHEGMLDGRDNLDQMAIGAIAAEKLRDYLDQGFTTARDAGGNTLGLAKAVKQDRIPGPRIYPSGGFMSQVGGHADTGRWNDRIGDKDMLEKNEFGYIVSGRAQMLEACRHNLRAGATQIKIMAGGGVASEFDPLHMTQFTVDEFKAAVEVAEDYGTYCKVHAYHDRSINRAIDAGVKSIEHGFLMSEETVKRMKKENIALSVQAVMSLEAFANPDAITFFNSDQKTKAKKVNSGATQMLKWALKHDLLMATGGDMFDKANANRQIDNMIILETIGYPAAKILEMGTGDAAKILSWCGEMNPYKGAYPDLTAEERAEKGIGLGVIEKGAYADILVVNGDPIADLKLMRDRDNLQLIIKDGKVWKNTLVPATHPEHTPSLERHTPSGTL